MGMHPPFFFVLPKKNGPCTVEEKGALHTLWLRQRVDRESPQTLPTKSGSLLPGALYTGTRRKPTAAKVSIGRLP